MITPPGNLTSPRAGPILCRCAPAIIIKTGRRGIVDFVAVDANEHRPGTWARFLYDDDGDGSYVWGADPLPEPRPLDVIRLAAIGLDLTADLGPTIALRWLGRHYGLTFGVGAPGWHYNEALRAWFLKGEGYNNDIGFASDAVNMKPTDYAIPGISEIRDPLEALVAACLHAAGVPRE